MCSLHFENNYLTIKGVHFASILKKTPFLSFCSLSFQYPCHPCKPGHVWPVATPPEAVEVKEWSGGKKTAGPASQPGKTVMETPRRLGIVQEEPAAHHKQYDWREVSTLPPCGPDAQH
jgi:hypothetical protein